jgi:predicted phosphoribosyltransferase
LILNEERPVYQDRADAGAQLAAELEHYEGSDALVCAVPRGGVPVAIEVAKRLGARLDVVVTRKIPIPQSPEAGYGAVTEDGTVVLNEPLVSQLRLSESQIRSDADRVRIEIGRRSKVLRNVLPRESVEGQTCILVDDGLASGFTMLSAVESIRARNARQVVVASPVASGSAYDMIKPVVDELVCPVVARVSQFAVAAYYRRWHDLTDDEMLAYIRRWRRTGALTAGET